MKGPFIIAYDLGTGGNKASLYDVEGRCLSANFAAYSTHYPRIGWHEQCPVDWWNAVVESTRRLLAESGVSGNEVACCGTSGHSLGVVPLGRNGQLLREKTPIWSDSRPQEQARKFFETVDEVGWYLQTGGGFPPPLYSVFKIMWYRDREPELFRKIWKVIGTKDFVNFKLTGRVATDFSYASGSGVYDLARWNYSDTLVAASGLPREIFADPVPSTEVLGELTSEAAEALGLSRKVKVVAGGVDNSCMALGARAFKEGRVYNAIGSSSWIAVTSAKPLLDPVKRPYVFAHVVPGRYTSATAIFSAGSSFRWVRDTIARDLLAEAEKEHRDVYDLMAECAAASPPGANGLLFNPSLAGGSSLDESPAIRGSLVGIDLRHTQADLIRAAMEGIALGLCRALDALRSLTVVDQELLMVGGGSKSLLWRQIYADVFQMRVIKTSIDQQAAALGAAALAAVGTGLWDDFNRIDAIHTIEAVAEPDPGRARLYERLLPLYEIIARHHAEIGEKMRGSFGE